jgi:hypothetical protein
MMPDSRARRPRIARIHSENVFSHLHPHPRARMQESGKILQFWLVLGELAGIRESRNAKPTTIAFVIAY